MMGLAKLKTTMWFLLLVFSVEIVSAEDSCYGAGAIATSVVLSVIVTLLIIGAIYYWIRRKPSTEHLILETDPEKGKTEYAFDNPGFKDTGLLPLSKSVEKTTPKFESEKTGKQKWNNWPGLSALTTKSEKRKTQDDSVLEDNQVKVVALRSHDFTGLGFNICGNMKDGIFIKDILHRGPASESGKLNQGDKINSVTISFEHIVYEDALTILSYASPYEVIIEAKSGKIQSSLSSKSNHPYHPIYRSSSSADLHQVEKSARRKLQADNSLGSNYSSLHKSMSNMTTLERKGSQSPKPIHLRSQQNNSLNSEQLKNQLEQRISSAETEARLKSEPVRIEIETQKTENKHQRFGVKVFPSDQHNSPKISELSHNDNNINIEKNKTFTGLDEVDTVVLQAEKRKKKVDEIPENQDPYFIRNNSLNGSGLKRDSNGIPQEIPAHMLNAAVAARRNRKSLDEISHSEEELKAPKKIKGKAPLPPPEDSGKEDDTPIIASTITNSQVDVDDNTEATPRIFTETTSAKANTSSLKEYISDSDDETDNQSSVNTIELNSSDITIHHEENEQKQNRKTASTGDLTKIHKTRKSSTGTLERAQSLDITDTGIPTLTKIRKGGRIDDQFDIISDDDLFGQAMNKEPRLSLILDGLNTFQRNRLKKSTEWGNLEDAILKSSQDDNSISPAFEQNTSVENLSFNLGEKSAELDALVNKINEIRRESQEIEEIRVETPELVHMEQPPSKELLDVVKNQIWPTETEKLIEIKPLPPIKIRSRIPSTTSPAILPKPKVRNEIWPKELEEESPINRNDREKEEIVEDNSLTENVHQGRNDNEKREDMIQMVTITKNVQSHVIPNINQKSQEIIRITTPMSSMQPINDLNDKEIKDSIKIKTLADPETERKDISSMRIDENLRSLINKYESPTSAGVGNKTISPGGNTTELETSLEKKLNIHEKQEHTNANSDNLIDVELQISEHKDSSNLINKKIDLTPSMVSGSSQKIQKRQQIPNGKDEIPPPPGMSESNLEQEIFDELRRNCTSPEIHENETTQPNRSISPEASSSIAPPELRHKTNDNNSSLKRNSETGEMCTEINNTDESKTSLGDINPRYLNDTQSFIFNERYLISQDDPYQTLPEDTNISDDIKVSRHSLGSLERPKSDDAKSIETLKYTNNVSNVTINSVQTENGSSNLHSLEFSVNEPLEEINHSILSENNELYTTALNKTLKSEKDASKITISTPDLIKNVTITEAINTLNSHMDQTTFANLEIKKPMEEKLVFAVTDSLTNGINDTNNLNGDTKSNMDSAGKNHSSLTYITEIQVTPNNGNANISEFEIVPSSNVGPKEYSRNLDNEFENYVKNFEVKSLDNTKNDVKVMEENITENDIVASAKIDPEKELHKIQEIAQEQLKKLPEMRFSTSSYENPSRIPEKRQSQIELLKSNFEKSPQKCAKPEIVTKSRIPISTTMKTPPTSPERRDSKNLDIENEKEILELMCSSVHSTPMTNTLKYQKSSPNKNVTITSIRNNSKIPSGLPILGGNRPPVPPKKPEQEMDSMVQVSTNTSNINSFKQWVFDPVDSVTNISLSGHKTQHK